MACASTSERSIRARRVTAHAEFASRYRSAHVRTREILLRFVTVGSERNKSAETLNEESAKHNSKGV